jgi:succinoglycan biosynthesis transport protein ExoP
LASRPEVLAFKAFSSLRAGSDFAIHFLRRRYLTILICLLLSTALGTLYFFITPTSYTASAVMMIETRKSPFQSSAGEERTNAGWIESQVEVLKSRNVATYVVKRLRLANDPEFVRSDAGVFAMLGFASEPQSEAERVEVAIDRLRDGLEARRLGMSFTIEISFRSNNKDQALKVADAMIDAYIYHQLNAKYEANRRAGEWLQERLQALEEQATTAERAVVEFKAKNNIVAADRALMNEKELTELSGQVAAARSHLSDVKARLERVQTIRRGYQEGQPAWVADGTVFEALNGSIITKLRTQYLELMTREADWSARYGKNHSAVVKLRDEARATRRSLNDELGRYEEAYRSEFEIAKKRQEDAEEALAAVVSQSTKTNEAKVNLVSLEAAAQSYRKLYDNFVRQHAESVQQQSLPTTDAQGLSAASIIKTHSRAVLVLLASIFAGGMLGIGFGVLREIMDAGFRTKEQVQFALETECVALVPRFQDDGSQNPINTMGGEARNRQSLPAYTEAIRSIKLTLDLNLDLNLETPDLISKNDTTIGKVIGVTSCSPKEGKSTIAAAIASFIAKSGARVILVDCDVRNPSLSRSLAPNAKLGILDLIYGKVDSARAILTDLSTGMAFLPSVSNQDLVNLTDISSGGAKLLFAALQKKYEYIIVDLAPLAAGPDVLSSTRVIDSYLLVIEWGRTKIEAVQYALRNVPSVQENILGAVLNKVDIAAMGRYDSYSATEYYGWGKHARSTN